jgi:hypothetical protein
MMGTEEQSSDGHIPVDVDVALQKSASAAIWARSECLGDFRFDEKLGLGAAYRAGEDLDLVLTMLLKGSKGLFAEGLRVGHPLRDKSTEYFPGSIAVLAKHLNKNFFFAWPIIRRLIHGMVLVFRGKLTFSSFILACRAVSHRNVDHAID